MKKKLDWVVIGRFVALLVDLYTIISAVFKKAKIGLEAIEWLVGPGKSFLEGKVAEIVEEFERQNPEPVAQASAPKPLEAEVDLDAALSLPFAGATIEKHIGGGKVKIEKRADGLYVNGKKVVLHRSVRQVGGKWLNGHELREGLTGKPVLNACVLDFLIGHTEFIPDDWKVDEAGKTIFIYFWGTIYRDADGDLFVRYLYWGGGAWSGGYRWLDDEWDSRSPAALLAS